MGETPKLEFLTGHLPYFNDLDRATKIYGSEYGIIKKALWYYIFSIPFRQVTINLGDIETDCRCNFAFPMPSGSGKKNFIETPESIAKKLGLSVAKPVSFHPEQLIGKVIRKSGRKSIFDTFDEIRGWLSLPVVIFEEAIDLVRSNEPLYKESRKYLVISLDPYGKNELIGEKNGVLVVHPKILPEFICQLRKSLIEIQKTSLSHVDRDRKEAKLFEYLKSREFESLIKDVEKHCQNLDKLQDDEEKNHHDIWELRRRLLTDIKSKRNRIEANVSSIIQDSLTLEKPVIEPIPVLIRKKGKKIE